MSCSKDESGKKLLEQELFSSYVKEASYILSDGEKNSEGELIVTRSDTNTLQFTCPDTLSGITVQSDETGKEGTYTLSFDGVSTDVPKSLMGKISLIFLLISDDTASGVKKLSQKDCYKITDSSVTEAYSDKLPYGVKLKVADITVSITYDSLTGEILSMSAAHSDNCATLIFNTAEDIGLKQE